MIDLLSSGKRDKVELLAAIIAMTRKPSNFTRIMDNVGLSYQLMKKYLKLMHEHDLIKTIKVMEKDQNNRHFFQATEKGNELLDAYCQILRIVYGEDFLEKANNLAVDCIKYCKNE